jgi:two-component system LytT family response regulator
MEDGRMNIRALLVDDEPLALGRLRNMLETEFGVDVVGEAETAAAALTLASSLAPDVVFLDIRMPKVSGLELVSRFRPRPVIVFTTAYPEFAVDAFDESAIDYLVKPVLPERLGRTMNRLRNELVRRQSEGSGTPPPPRATVAERIAVRTRSEVIFIDVAEICWIGAEGNYSRVHTATKSYLMRELINSIAQRLDPAMFVRVHRSSIVNVNQIVKLVTTRATGNTVVLTNGTSVRVGASYREDLERVLGGPF